MRTGDTCPTCGTGTMRRYKTKTVGLNRTRYLKCDRCGATGKHSTAVDAKGRDVIARSDPQAIGCPCCGFTIRA